MKNVLILTGCAGFIGIHVLEKLHGSHGFDYIISIDKMGYATEFNSKWYYELCDTVRSIYDMNCDINDSNSMFNTLDLDKWVFIDDWKNTDLYILDLASESHVDNSITDPFSIYKSNAGIPANLLLWIGKDNWSRIKAYYHVSTDEIYGELSLEQGSRQSSWFQPTNQVHPNNPYSASKAAQDCFLMSLRHTFKLPVKFIRMANQFGIRQHPEKMLPASILRVLNGDSIKIYGTGENLRQWTPVEITAGIIVDILDEKIIFDDVIHIANRWGLYSNNQIVDKLCVILDKKGITAKKEYVEDRKGHDVCYALDTKKEVDHFFGDYLFMKDFDTELEKVVDFYIKHKKEYLK